jgi:hypothetical protein
VPIGELATAISGLEGSRFVGVGRTLNMVEAGFLRNDEEMRLHVQCPFRIVRDGRILLGSTDYLYARNRGTDPDVAFDRYDTHFDRIAQRMKEMLGDGLFVIEAHLRDDGAFHLATTEKLRIEVFPAVSGPIECWRLFVKGAGKHYIYPPSQ